MPQRQARTSPVAIAVVLALTATGALAASAAETAIATRQAGYKKVGAAFKGINDELRKDAPNAKLIAANATALNAQAAQVNKWFPKGSGPRSRLQDQGQARDLGRACQVRRRGRQVPDRGGQAADHRRGGATSTPSALRCASSAARARLATTPTAPSSPAWLTTPRPEWPARYGTCPRGSCIGPSWSCCLSPGSPAGENMQLHRWTGYTILGVLVFRLWWGVAGGSTARFAHFLAGPGRTFAYLRTVGRRSPGETAGHNPLGAWSVLAMIVVLLVQVGLGLFASDIDGLESGPLSHLIDFDASRAAADLHELSFRVLQALVALHILAVAFYWVWKRQNLVGAMITGKRPFQGEALRPAGLWSYAVGLVLAFAVAWFIAKGLRF
jgi:cytochrome b